MGSAKMIINLVIFLILLTPLTGQGQEMPDSLIMELERTYDKERRLEILWEVIKLINKKDPDTAIYFAKKQRDLAKIIENKKGYVNAVWALGRIYKRKEKLKEAVAFLFEAHDGYEMLNNEPMVASALYNIGQVFMNGYDFENALLYLHKALNQYRNLEDNQRQAYAHYEIARCYVNTANYEKSLFHLDQSLSLNCRETEMSFTSKIYNYIGINYYKLKSYDKAIENYSKAEKYAVGLEDYNTKSAMAYNNIGEVYVEKKDYVRAWSHYEKALELKRKLGDKELLAGTLINLGKLALLENKPSEAISYLEEITCILDKDRLSNNLKEATVLLAEAYKSKQNLTTKDLQKIMALNEQYAQHIHNLKQTGFQQSMISTISKNTLENEAMYLKEKAEKTRNFSLWIASFSMIIIVGFLILLYYRERKFKLFIQKMWEDIKDI